MLTAHYLNRCARWLQHPNVNRGHNDSIGLPAVSKLGQFRLLGIA